MNRSLPALRRAIVLLSVTFATSAVAQSLAGAPDANHAQSIAGQGKTVVVEDLSPAEAVELYKTLPAPSMQEMNGEFSGEMLSFPTLYTRIFWNVASKNPIYPGIWQGKSFRQTGPNAGRGYNSVWRVFAGKVDMWPMLTTIGPSYFDGKPSFQLVYRAFDHYAGEIHMLDEVRRLPDGRYLGIGRTGTSTEERRMPMPFLLKAKIGTYREDIGTPRAGFDMAREFELLEFPASAYQPAVK